MPSPKAAENMEWQGIRLIGIICVGLIVVALGMWVWKSSLPPQGFTEMIFISSPQDVNGQIVFAVQLNSFETKDTRIHLSAFFNNELVLKKIVELNASQQKRVPFSVPTRGTLSSNVEIKVIAQRYLDDGNKFRNELEVRDWLIIEK